MAKLPIGYKPRRDRKRATSEAKSFRPTRESRPKPGLGFTKPDAPAAAAPPKPPLTPQKPELDQPYLDTVDSIDRHEQSSLSQLGGAEDKTKFEFGIGDPTNPFSRANALKKSYLARAKGVSASLASQGQLYSGAHERALARTRSDQEQAYAQLRSAFDDAMGSISKAKGDVKFSSEQDRLKAFQDWLARAPEADVPVEEEPAPAASASAAPSSPAGPDNSLFQARTEGDAGKPPAAPAPGLLRKPPKSRKRHDPTALSKPKAKPKPKPKAKPKKGRR